VDGDKDWFNPLLADYGGLLEGIPGPAVLTQEESRDPDDEDGHLGDEDEDEPRLVDVDRDILNLLMQMPSNGDRLRVPFVRASVVPVEVSHDDDEPT